MESLFKNTVTELCRRIKSIQDFSLGSLLNAKKKKKIPANKYVSLEVGDRCRQHLLEWQQCSSAYRPQKCKMCIFTSVVPFREEKLQEAAGNMQRYDHKYCSSNVECNIESE